MYNKRMKNQGFTLIELMIAVTIVAIMLGIALPSYFQQVAKANRSEAKIELLRIAQMQEEYFAQNLSYANSLTQLGLSSDTVNTENLHYEVTLASMIPGDCTGTAASSCTGFSIRATPISDTQTSDTPCPRFTLSHTGLKGTTGSATTDQIKACWR